MLKNSLLLKKIANKTTKKVRGIPSHHRFKVKQIPTLNLTIITHTPMYFSRQKKLICQEERLWSKTRFTAHLPMASGEVLETKSTSTIDQFEVVDSMRKSQFHSDQAPSLLTKWEEFTWSR